MPNTRTFGALTFCLVLLGSTLTPASDLAFTNIKLGEPLPDLQLVTIDGPLERYLGPTETRASVFAFIKAHHKHSEHLIAQWQELQSSFAGQGVHWVLIISDRHEAELTAPWDSLAPGSTVLIDSGDQLYGQLGVALTPTVGIADQDGVLQAFLPYRQINYPAIISAHVRKVLGTITPEEMEKLLNPSGGAKDTQRAGAKRKIKLSRMLLKRGRLEGALSQVESALAECPELKEGYLLLAEIHSAAGRTDEAKLATERADSLAATLENHSREATTDSISPNKTK